VAINPYFNLTKNSFAPYAAFAIIPFASFAAFAIDLFHHI